MPKAAGAAAQIDILRGAAIPVTPCRWNKSAGRRHVLNVPLLVGICVTCVTRAGVPGGF